MLSFLHLQVQDLQLKDPMRLDLLVVHQVFILLVSFGKIQDQVRQLLIKLAIFFSS